MIRWTDLAHSVTHRHWNAIDRYICSCTSFRDVVWEIGRPFCVMTSLLVAQRPGLGSFLVFCLWERTNLKKTPRSIPTWSSSVCRLANTECNWTMALNQHDITTFWYTFFILRHSDIRCVSVIASGISQQIIFVNKQGNALRQCNV